MGILLLLSHLILLPFLVISMGLVSCNLHESKLKPAIEISFMSLNIGDTWRYRAIQGWRLHGMRGLDSSLLTIRLMNRDFIGEDTSYSFELKDSCIFRSELNSGYRPVQVDTLKFPLSPESILLFNQPPASVIYPPFVYYQFFLKDKIRTDTSISARNLAGEWVDSALVSQVYSRGTPIYVFQPSEGEMFLENVGLYHHTKNLAGSATSSSYFEIQLIEFNGEEITLDSLR